MVGENDSGTLLTVASEALGRLASAQHERLVQRGEALGHCPELFWHQALDLAGGASLPHEDVVRR
jgi:hypothetical protein